MKVSKITYVKPPVLNWNYAIRIPQCRTEHSRIEIIYHVCVKISNDKPVFNYLTPVKKKWVKKKRRKKDRERMPKILNLNERRKFN